MKKHWYLINISGSNGFLQCTIKEGGKPAAIAFYYGLRRGFPTDYVTLHEISEDLKTGKLSTRHIKMQEPTK